MFAFMTGPVWPVVLAVLAVGFLLRVARRDRVRGRHCFPWKTAALVVLFVIAVKHFGTPKFSWTFDDDVARFVHGHAVNQGFPPVKQQDLWALRRAEEKPKSADERKRRREEVEARAEEVRQRAAHVAVRAARRDELPPDKPSDDELDATIEALASSPHVPADVITKVAEARDLARRVIDEGRAIYARTKRDAKALAVMARRKSDEGGTTESVPAASATAPSRVVSSGPATELATAAAPSAPIDAAATTELIAAPADAAVPASAPVAPSAAAIAAAPAPVPGAPTSALPQPKPKDKKRPPWVDEPPGREGDIYYTSVTVGPHKDVQGCEEELPTELERAVKAYIDNYLGPGASKTFHVPQAFIQDRIVKPPYYIETKDFGETDPLLGEMFNLHARLAFDGRVRSQLQRMWREAQVENRLLDAGAVAGVVLLLLGTIFGYLKLDTLTRGYYTRRLQFATAAVILGTVAAVLYSIRSGRSEPGLPDVLSRPVPVEARTEFGPPTGEEKASERRTGKRDLL